MISMHITIIYTLEVVLLYCTNIVRNAITINFFPNSTVVSHWKLEIGHDRNIYTTNIKYYKLGFDLLFC